MKFTAFVVIGAVTFFQQEVHGAKLTRVPAQSVDPADKWAQIGNTEDFAIFDADNLAQSSASTDNSSAAVDQQVNKWSASMLASLTPSLNGQKLQKFTQANQAASAVLGYMGCIASAGEINTAATNALTSGSADALLHGLSPIIDQAQAEEGKQVLKVMFSGFAGVAQVTGVALKQATGQEMSGLTDLVSAGDAYKDFFGPLVSEGVFDKGAFYNMGTKLPIFSDLAASTNSIINLTKKFGKQAEDACYRSWTMRPYESRIASRVRESVGKVVSAIAGAVKGAVKVASKAAGAAAGAVKAGVKASVKAVTGVGGKATPPATPAPPAAAPAADTELVTKAAAKPMFAWKNCRPVVANGEKLYDTELYASVFCLRVDCPATFSGFANNGKCGFMCATDEFCRDVVANVMSDIIGLAASTASLAMQGGTNPITILSMVTKILSLMDTIIQPKCNDITISPKLQEMAFGIDNAFDIRLRDESGKRLTVIEKNGRFIYNPFGMYDGMSGTLREFQEDEP